jgi:hypothetical protein
MIHQLIYSSEASPDLSDGDLEDILTDSRIDNAERDVTGALLFVDRVFVQILEGTREAIDDLMMKIERDPRHHSVTVFHEGEAPARVFESWRMAFLNPSPADISRWAGFPGTETMAEITASLERHPERVPEVLLKIVHSLTG